MIFWVEKYYNIAMLKNISNKLDFFLRKNIKFSRGIYRNKNEDKNDLFIDAEMQITESEYLHTYNLEQLKNNSTRSNYLENLYAIEFLEKNSEFDFSGDSIKVLDVGCKNFFYASGLYSFFRYKSHEKQIKLTGIEIDGYRLYSNFHSRYDYAKFYIQNLENAEFIVDDVLNHNEKYDVITCILPFVFKEPLLAWGLSLSEFNPKKITQKMYDLLEKNGELLIVNQGLAECEKQKEILGELNIKYKDKGIFESIFFDYSYDRYVLKVKKV